MWLRHCHPSEGTAGRREAQHQSTRGRKRDASSRSSSRSAHGSCPSGRGCTAEAPAGGNYRPAGKLWQCLEARGTWRHPPGSGKQGPPRAETPSWAQVPRHRAWSSPALEPVPARAATSGRRHPERVPPAALQPLGDTSWCLTLSTEINGKHLPPTVLPVPSVCLSADKTSPLVPARAGRRLRPHPNGAGTQLPLPRAGLLWGAQILQISAKTVGRTQICSKH